MNDVLIVMSNPNDGRHDEFNDWYSNIHVRDVMRLPGSAAVQRLGLADAQPAGGGGAMPDRTYDYLAVYEVIDAELVSAGHSVCFSPAMLISDSFCFEMLNAYYSPFVTRDNRNAPPHEGDYVIERIDAPVPEGFAAWYADTRMKALMALPSVVTGRFMSIADHQMRPPTNDSWFFAIYRTRDPLATLAGWPSAPAFPEGTAARVSRYAPLIPRWTACDVLNPTAEDAAAEARARVAIGNRFHLSFPSAETTPDYSGLDVR